MSPQFLQEGLNSEHKLLGRKNKIKIKIIKIKKLRNKNKIKVINIYNS